MEFGELVSKLKQSNVSKDGDKTKARVKPLWRAANKDQREAILSLADVKDVSIRRVYVTGSISAKLASAISRTLNVNPYYLTGQVDEVGEYSEGLLVALLKDHKYDSLLAEAGLIGIVEKKRGRRKATTAKDKESIAAPIETSVVGETVATPEEKSVATTTADAPEEQPIITLQAEEPDDEPVLAPVMTIQIPCVEDVDLTEDESIILLKAVFLKAKAGGAGAEKARQLKAMLLS